MFFVRIFHWGFSCLIQVLQVPLLVLFNISSLILPYLQLRTYSHLYFIQLKLVFVFILLLYRSLSGVLPLQVLYLFANKLVYIYSVFILFQQNTLHKMLLLLYLTDLECCWQERLRVCYLIHTVGAGSYVLIVCPLSLNTFLLFPVFYLVLTILSKVSVPSGFVLV